MKTKFTLFFVLTLAGCLLTVVSCKKTPPSPPEYIVEGNVSESANGKVLYLMDYSLRKNLDSTVVDSGKFVFKGIVDTVRYCRINVDREYANLILEGGKITVDFEKHNASGSPLNQVLSDYNQQKDSLMKLSYQLYTQMKEQEKDPQRLKERLDSANVLWMSVYYQTLDRALDANTNNVIGMIVASDLAMSATTGKMDTVFAKLSSDIVGLQMVQRLKDRNELLKKTAEGMMYTDFTVEQPDGTKKSLSDYVGKGKYVLVDFWASWCGPCRGETPNMKEIYSKYKGDKFEIVGVAVWDKPEDSKKAIEEDKTTWPQILNAQETAQKLYGVNGIPHIMLIGPDGTIVARNLRDKAMIAKVAEVLKQ
ncbi:AhpC/TSA family protein [Dysgonomonas sp. Marseille-P4677]|uniref:TlpA disulfide reductase family protein n=1 Tax=Dysgonomonas sp. Marseille-P4677 TaxID=2364790 RepID=UPI001912C5CA|nr:TlpA disulfide reductase family protein [Dysgonomonas sp. Marseille-P4677]MBK5721861.1 AhpC/TSA family protein [Dysgonomonas sp. Marseille-P4677]